MKAGETINLSDLSDAIKKDKAAAQTTQPGKTNTRQTTQGAKQNYTRGKSATTPAATRNPSIKEKIQAGKEEIAKSKPAPERSRAAAQSRNAGLGD